MNIYICRDYKNARWRKKIAGGEKLSLAFARICVCDFIGRRAERVEIKFAENKYGKPFIKKMSRKNGGPIDREAHFSLSHSGDLLVCAVSRHNIGADCQLINMGAETCRKIAARFYSAQENLLLDALPEHEYANNFFEIWAKKEAYVKYTGKGLGEGLGGFSVVCGRLGARFVRAAPELAGAYIYICCGADNHDELRVQYVD